jgi:hypothetical protein
MKFICSIFIFIFCFPQSNAQVTFNRENLESLTSYLTDNNVEFEKKDLATLKDMDVFSMYNTYKLLVVPEAYFFNKEGYRVKGFNGADCAQAIQNLEKINKKRIDKLDTISNWIKYFTFFDNTDEDVLNSGYDFFIIINWAKFSPKEDEISFNWYRSLKTESKYKIKIIFANLDIQEDWVLSDVQKKGLKLN